MFKQRCALLAERCRTLPELSREDLIVQLENWETKMRTFRDFLREHPSASIDTFLIREGLHIWETLEREGKNALPSEAALATCLETYSDPRCVLLFLSPILINILQTGDIPALQSFLAQESIPSRLAPALCDHNAQHWLKQHFPQHPVFSGRGILRFLFGKKDILGELQVYPSEEQRQSMLTLLCPTLIASSTALEEALDYDAYAFFPLLTNALPALCDILEGEMANSRNYYYPLILKHFPAPSLPLRIKEWGEKYGGRSSSIGPRGPIGIRGPG